MFNNFPSDLVDHQLLIHMAYQITVKILSKVLQHRISFEMTYNVGINWKF